MVRSFLFEIKFHKYKYKVYEIKTKEKSFYDVLKYHKKGFFWVNIKNILKNSNCYYLRFNDYNKLIEYILL